MTKNLDRRTIYAQSSDIKSRTYLEYRKDMKRKAIAELEIKEWLQKKLEERHPNERVRVSKSGGDRFLWFLRKGGISRESDFVAKIGDREVEFEFQYAEKKDIKFYDFKVTKVAKKRQNKYYPISNKYFIYVHKPSSKYAILEPDWIIKNGKREMVAAWRSDAYRVPREEFEKLLDEDEYLNKIVWMINVKNFILDFQHQTIEIYKDKLSYLLQSIIDESNIVKLMPQKLDSFFETCFILDNINRIPKNPNSWLRSILTYVNKDVSLEDISKIVYCIDYLYSKIEMTENEIRELVISIKNLLCKINSFYQNDGSYRSAEKISPLEESRFALFSINLLEDLIQDLLHYYDLKIDLNPIQKIYENVIQIEKTYGFITQSQNRK